MSQAETLLRDLIALPSVNPAFVPAGDRRAGEKTVADFLTASAAHARLDVEQQEVSAGRPNVLIHLTPARPPKHRVILAPHTDTVPAEVFEPIIKGDRLFGRGACDTKGSIAAMLTALIAVSQSAQRPSDTEIVLAALVDEENGQAGSRALTASGFRGDLAIIGEPTQLHVITAQKGDVWLTLRTRGKAAHGSRPHLGINAVHEMARVVGLLETRYARMLAKRKHPVLGAPTVNVGVIQGGSQPNIVPDLCVIHVDRRTIPGETVTTVKREIGALLKANKLRAQISDQKSAPCLPMETDPELPFVKRFMNSVGQRRPEGVHYFSDAAVFAQAGTPAVLFGPGDIAQAHTVDEWVSLRSLNRATTLLRDFLLGLP